MQDLLGNSELSHRTDLAAKLILGVVGGDATAFSRVLAIMTEHLETMNRVVYCTADEMHFLHAIVAPELQRMCRVVVAEESGS